MGQLEAMWRATPWAPYGLAVSLLAAALVALPLARRHGTSVAGTGLWLLLLGVVVTLTMTPGLSRLTVRQCGLDVPGLPSPADLLAVRERGLNVWMYVPLALLAVLPRRGRTWRAALGVTAALPFVAEATQWAVPALGRQCQSQDVAGNLTGVAVGVALGLVVRGLRAAARGYPRPGRTARTNE